VDGGLRTAKDIIVGAILGAEEFGFGTTLLVSLGCVQDRRCHCDTCPVGIATQNECLRKKFAGKPEHIVNFLHLLAEEVRETLAALGLKSLRDAIGRTDLLESTDTRFDFSAILASKKVGNSTLELETRTPTHETNYDERELIPAVEKGETRLERTISNCDRSVGAALSGLLAANNSQLPTPNSQLLTPNSKLSVLFTGTAGQSFGAFLHRDIAFTLDGEANDYVGKSLSGGAITIKGNVGNVIGYGATSGSIFISGTAGERFAIRNSGATLFAEGVGDHGCEYMTGGKVVVLGPTGVNFGAGMTGGVAYVLDETGDFDLKCNLDSIDLASVAAGSDDERELLSLLREHIARTASPLAERLLADWSNVRPRFVKVAPAKSL
ncbi:MAG: glutamate synthase subunit alpha, partial [Kiritimatiellae bacterium]|nr:glutamate synthase subunit alpha [Kiritimatiellia bacterium]